MEKNNLRIDILGTNITISTDEEPEYLNMLMGKYRNVIENVRRISGLNDPLKLAILTGFLLCDDLEKTAASKEKKDVPDAELEQITLSMISRLEEILAPPILAPSEESPCESS